MLPELKVIPFDVAMCAVEEYMATDDARNATAEALRILLTTMRDGAAPIRDAILDLATRVVKIRCPDTGN